MKRSDDEIIAALISSRTYKDAAAALCISERTLYQRLRQDGISEKLAAARAHIVDDAAKALRHNALSAVYVLQSVMENEEIAPQTRVYAAQTVLAQYLKLTEREDILARIDRLEGLK